MIPVALALFAFAMVGLWWVRRRQLNSLSQQKIYLGRFAEGVAAWRSKPGIPSDAREAVERLVSMPIGKALVRRLAIMLLQRQSSQELVENPFWLARQQLVGEQREAFDWLLTTFFLAFTYGDWIAGPFIRRTRFSGFSRQTQAEIALETVFSQQMGRAVHATAA